MDILPIVFSVSVIVLTIVLSVVGVQIIMILSEVKRTLIKFNDTLDVVEDKVHTVSNLFQSFGGALSGLKTGMQFFESFNSWIDKGKKGKAKDRDKVNSEGR